MTNEYKAKVVETARKVLQGGVDDAARAYRAALERMRDDVNGSLDRLDRYAGPTGSLRAQPEGYVDSLYLNVGSLATTVAAKAEVLEEARRLRDDTLARLEVG